MRLSQALVATSLALAVSGVQAQDTNAAEDFVRRIEGSVGDSVRLVIPNSKFHRGTLVIPVINGLPGQFNVDIQVGRIRNTVSQNLSRRDTVGVMITVKTQF